MSYFEDASLVLIPSAQKLSKIYSVKPTDGTGDLTFTRSNDTATRVGPDGLIEKVRTNLITYSEDFGNAAWTVDQVTKTTGQADPNGGTTAVLLTSTNTSSTYMYQVKAGLGCLSIYAKAGTRSTFALIPTSYNNGAFFDLSSVTATVSGIGYLAKIESVGGGWFRCSVATSNSTDFIVSLSNVAGGGSVIGDTMTFAFAQGESGDIATDYIATTSAAVSVGPVANVPRLDYLGSSCPRLLLEPQRTNYAPKSEQLTSWGTYGVGTITSTANAAISPDGYQNADEFTCTRTTSANAIFKYEVTSTLPAGSMTNSVWLKAKTSGDVGKKVCIWSFQGGNKGVYEATLTADWVRHSVAWTATATPTEIEFGLLNGYATSTLSVSFYAWGYQSENGAYATSYVNTLNSAVTRGADAASKTGISSLIGQTEGTIFWEGSGNAAVGGADLWMAAISVDDTNVAILLYYFALTGTVNAFINNGTAHVALAASMTLTQVNKVAVAYKNASYALYLNGALVDSSSSAIAPPTGMNQFAFVKWVGVANQDRELVNQALVFKTRLSNADLAALTA